MFDSWLMGIHNRFCPTCGSETEDVYRREPGAAVTFYWRCKGACWDRNCTWTTLDHAGPGQSPSIEFTTAVPLSANRYQNISSYFNILDINFISRTTYKETQCLYTIPQVSLEWAKMRQELLEVCLLPVEYLLLQFR